MSSMLSNEGVEELPCLSRQGHLEGHLVLHLLAGEGERHAGSRCFEMAIEAKGPQVGNPQRREEQQADRERLLHRARLPKRRCLGESATRMLLGKAEQELL